MPEKLRVAVATPLPPELCELIVEREPRIELVVEQDLLLPQTMPGDAYGDRSHRRPAAEQARFESLLDTAEAFYGVPDQSPRALARAVRANPGLRWVHTIPAGGGAQVKAAGLTPEELERIAFTTSAGVHGQSLAEFAVFGVFAGAKTLPRLLGQQQRKEWPARWTMAQVSSQTVLVLGLGGIGRAVAAKLSALGATVIGTSRSGGTAPGVARTVHADDLIGVLPEVDAVVATLPGTDATFHLIDDAFLGALKPGATIVNVGRGTVIDETALLKALDAGTVGFAALDVTEVEPLPADSPLWEHPRVLISPHTAAATIDEPRRIAELFAANATRLLDGEPLVNVVNTVEFY